MAWSNVTIPNVTYLTEREEFWLKQKIAETRDKFLADCIMGIRKEAYNIVESIEEYGYVTINGVKLIKDNGALE